MKLTKDNIGEYIDSKFGDIRERVFQIFHKELESISEEVHKLQGKGKNDLNSARLDILTSANWTISHFSVLYRAILEQALRRCLVRKDD